MSCSTSSQAKFAESNTFNTYCELSVPGIDLANHDFKPSAVVSIANSPDVSQGISAAEEVCDINHAEKGPVAVMRLLAGDDVIR